MSGAWSLYVIAIVVVNIAGCLWLLLGNRTADAGRAQPGEPLDHDFDGIRELNNPLPAWWMWLFVATIAFSVAYLALYPGLGSFAGMLGWSSAGEWRGEVEAAAARQAPLFARYLSTPLPELGADREAIDMGGRLFASTCSPCHGSDARGGNGYPNLTDGDWLWGGSPERIVETITHGRIGNMPALGPALGGDEMVRAMAHYVLSLSGREHDAAHAAKAQPLFAICAACHGPEGKGNPEIGVPNLTDGIWLHGGRTQDIEYQITNGRINVMPPHGALLGPAKVHVVAAYVYALSHDAASAPAPGRPAR
jgi:cytochrome c oxidase cbb3-type subunit 3